MSRDIVDIKADYEKAVKCDELIDGCAGGGIKCKFCEYTLPYSLDEIKLELLQALTANIPLDELEQMCVAKREGRCVALPCKVGDTAWINFSFSGDYLRKKDRPFACKIVFIGLNEGENFFNIVTEKERMHSFKFTDIGKTVFLTQAEAEKALEVSK